METTQTETKPGTDRLTVRKWRVKPLPDPKDLEDLRAIPGLQPQMAPLLWQRGIRNEPDLRAFFNPDLAQLGDPFSMADMDRAVDRLLSARNAGEKIMVFGDYDVDGTTATALVYQCLRDLGFEAVFYIPDRYKEGYGLSEAGVRHAAASGIGLILMLDCGIKAHEKIELANLLGLECVVCDHHLPGNTLPPAHAVLDPKRSDCQYPCKDLSGCGVGFTLMRGLYAKLGLDPAPLFRHLDLVAISVAADIVPITGENRILVAHGLLQLNQDPSPGIRALMLQSGFKPDESGVFSLKVDRLVFGLGPRINAAGRISHGEGAVQLLIATREEEALQLAGAVDEHNFTRKELDKNTTREALEQISILESRGFTHSSVLFQPHWHKGVIGIVASRCIEHHYRPTIILTESEGKLSGSGRSIAGFDLYAALDDCAGHLIQFGGHAFAAGLTLKPENLEPFSQAFEARVRSQLSLDELQPWLEIDMELTPRTISYAFWKQLQRMEPFGPGNLNPLFCLRQLRDSGMSRFLENKSGGPGHLKLSLTHPDLVYEGRPYVLEGIAFGMGDWWDKLVSKEALDFVFHLDENIFRGNRNLQLVVKDIRLSHSTD